MRLWPRRRRRGPDVSAQVQELANRVQHLERRVADVEDDVRLAVAPDRLDRLAARIDDLVLTLATHDELLEVRLHSARVASELTRVTAELRAELDRLVVALDVA